MNKATYVAVGKCLTVLDELSQDIIYASDGVDIRDLIRTALKELPELKEYFEPTRKQMYD